MLSIVLPAYNEEQMVEKTCQVLTELMLQEQIEFELVFVDDGSSDSTWSKLQEICENNSYAIAVHFSRNFGKESAILAGLAHATGECVAVMDCDLQHPPATLVKMYRLWEDGYEVVEGVKKNRGKESIFHKMSAGLFYKIMTKAVKIDMSSASDFKLMDRKVVEALLNMPEKNAFFRALSSWVGYKSISVEFDVQEREAGNSKWSTKSLIKYALTNIVSFSSAPMQFVSFAGGITFLVAIVLTIQTLINYFSGNAENGFTTVIILLLFIGSIIMISLGVIGYYISKIYEEVKGRPRYLVSKIVGTPRHK